MVTKCHNKAAVIKIYDKHLKCHLNQKHFSIWEQYSLPAETWSQHRSQLSSKVDRLLSFAWNRFSFGFMIAQLDLKNTRQNLLKNWKHGLLSAAELLFYS